MSPGSPAPARPPASRPLAVRSLASRPTAVRSSAGTPPVVRSSAGTPPVVRSSAGRPLVVAAHGTASEEGRQVVERCAAAAAEEIGVAHAVGYVDVCGPSLEEVLSTPPGADAVVVPFFLASGYHVRHDVPGAVSGVPGSTVTPALGVEPEVLEALADRVLEVLPDADGVVVTGAGSSVDGARAEVARAAVLLGERLGIATGTAFLSGPGPRPPEEVARLRDAGSLRIALASHLLAPGHFLDRARGTALELGRVATGPLGTHPALTDLVVRRYREAVAEQQPRS